MRIHRPAHAVLVGSACAVSLLACAAPAGAVTIAEEQVLPHAAQLDELVAAPDGRLLFPAGPGVFVDAGGSPGIGFYDPARKRAGVLALPGRPSSLAVAGGAAWTTSPTGQQQVSSSDSVPITKTDLASGAVTASIDAGRAALLGASPDGRMLYVSRTSGGPGVPEHGEVVAIDAVTNAVGPVLMATPPPQPSARIGVASDGAIWAHEINRPGVLLRRDPATGATQSFSAATPAFVNRIVAGDHGDVWARLNRGGGNVLAHADPSAGAAIVELPSIDGASVRAVCVGPDRGLWYVVLTKGGSLLVRVDQPTGQQQVHPVPTASTDLNACARSADGRSLWFAGSGPTTNLVHVTFDGQGAVANSSSIAKGGLLASFRCSASCSARATLEATGARARSRARAARVAGAASLRHAASGSAVPRRAAASSSG